MRARLFSSLVMLALLVASAALADDDAQPAPQHKLTEATSYLALDPIYTTIVDDQRVQGMLMVSIGVDVPDAALREQANRALPLLRDAYIRNLMNFTATSVHTTAQPDAAAIAARLQAVTDRALGRKGARILLAQVALRVTN